MHRQITVQCWGIALVRLFFGYRHACAQTKGSRRADTAERRNWWEDQWDRCRSAVSVWGRAVRGLLAEGLPGPSSCGSLRMNAFTGIDMAVRVWGAPLVGFAKLSSYAKRCQPCTRFCPGAGCTPPGAHPYPPASS
jgi:hypothetical protein